VTTHADPADRSAALAGHLSRLPGGPLGRPVYLWTYGFYGPPLIAFPTSGGYAHEWQQNGMVEALRPLLAAGRLKLYCPETNVAEAWMHGTDHPRERIRVHQRYERWVTEVLVPHIWADCRGALPIWLAGASVGAMYASAMALKHPALFSWALCLSGRYDARSFTDGYDDGEIYHSNPMTFARGIHGEQLSALRARTTLSLVCGQGKYEANCLAETKAMASHLRHAGVPHELDVWGRDVHHEWPWWHRQTLHHLRRRT
jgi:esterase/lipase superfamily enzyme